MNNKILHNLDPANLLIDDREIDDLILFINKLSNEINYFNNKNSIDGSWSDFFSDQTFLLAEISKFEIKKYDVNRLNLIKSFDEFSSEEEKEKILKDFFILIYKFFYNVNIWYKKALNNNLSIKSSSIEFELEQAIQNKLKKSFELFYSFSLSFNKTNNLGLSFDNFNSIWNIKSVNEKDIFSESDLSQSIHSSALKKLILLYNPIYEVLFSLKKKSIVLFKQSFNYDDNHNPHVGLLFSFLELFKHHKIEINNITKRHLDFYYKNILKQIPVLDIPNKVHLNIQIDENIDSLVINEGEGLIAGQESDGDDIIYKTNNEIILNNSKISEISSLFISRNKTIDFNSSFRLVSGIFSNSLAKSKEEVDEFNLNNKIFSSFGEDQTFKSSSFKSMAESKLGFAVSSPTLISSNSIRNLKFDLYFTVDSIQYLSNLILDISNNSDESEEEIFTNVFSNSFKISYTSSENWVSIDDYTIEYPNDWSKGVISVKIKLNKNFPSISHYNNQIHQINIQTNYPVFQFLLNDNNFYYPYSFLNGVEITRIDIDLEVSNLKDLKLFNVEGSIPNNSEFEMFGSNPALGSKLYVGNNEIFCKKIEKISFGWDYTNIPHDFNNLSEYYKNYNYLINNDSFKIRIEALSDYVYNRNSEIELIFNLFDVNSDGISKKKLIRNIDCDVLKLKPSFDLVSEDIDVYSNDLETGFVKIELCEPKIGFGFNIYPKVLEQSIEDSAKIKSSKDSNKEYVYPNEPFSPKISDLFVNYSSKTSILFNDSSENDVDQFFLIHPNEGYNKVSSNIKSNTNLVPELNSQGELLIGFDEVRPSQDVNLFFEIKKNENTNYSFSSDLDWYYSSHNGWKIIEKSNILYDETINLMKTGVICFKLNSDLSTKSIIPINKKFYIKACSKNQVDQFSLISKILVNAVLATQELKVNSSNDTILPNSLQNFKESVQGVVNINQPLSSFGGVKKESDFNFYKRVSELLSHKNRPSNINDIENFILSKFNWLSYVKCFNGNYKNSVKCLCMKKIRSDQIIDEVKLSQADISEIKEYIQSYISPFLRLEIINPIFEEVWIKAKVKFINIPSGKGVFNLNKDLLHFFCSWILNENFKKMNIGGSFKRSEIINFIKSRPYIGYLTGFSIIHIKINENGNMKIFDSATKDNSQNFIKAGTQHSILVPRDYNQIQIMENEKYYPPEKTNFSDLNIEENFIISDEEDIALISRKVDDDLDEGIENTTINFKF